MVSTPGGGDGEPARAVEIQPDCRRVGPTSASAAHGLCISVSGSHFYHSTASFDRVDACKAFTSALNGEKSRENKGKSL